METTKLWFLLVLFGFFLLVVVLPGQKHFVAYMAEVNSDTQWSPSGSNAIAEYWLGRGHMRNQVNDYAGATACFRRATQWAPGWPKAWSFLLISRTVQEYSRIGQWDGTVPLDEALFAYEERYQRMLEDLPFLVDVIERSGRHPRVVYYATIVLALRFKNPLDPASAYRTARFREDFGINPMAYVAMLMSRADWTAFENPRFRAFYETRIASAYVHALLDAVAWGDESEALCYFTRAKILLLSLQQRMVDNRLDPDFRHDMTGLVAYFLDLIHRTIKSPERIIPGTNEA